MPFRELASEPRLDHLNRPHGQRRVDQAAELANTEAGKWKHDWQGDQGLCKKQEGWWAIKGENMGVRRCLAM